MCLYFYAFLVGLWNFSDCDIVCFSFYCLSERIMDPIQTLCFLATKNCLTISLANLLTLNVHDEWFYLFKASNYTVEITSVLFYDFLIKM